MNILHLIGDINLPRNPYQEGVSGVTRSTLAIAKASIKLGNTVSVAAIGPEEWQSTWQSVHLVGLRELSWARVRTPGREIDFGRHLPYILYTNRHTFDVVHGQNYAYLRFLRAGLRVVHYRKDPFRSGDRAKFTSIRKYSDLLVANSHFTARQLQKGIGASVKVHVLYNGVDASRFNSEVWTSEAAELRKEWNVRSSDVVFLYAGAFDPVKGIIHLAGAFSRLAEDVPGAHLVLAGSDALWRQTPLSKKRRQDYQRDVESLLQPGLVAGKVHFMGKVPAEKMPVVYSASDVTVVPSVWQETFGNVAIESLACSRPVIASNIGGLVEIVDESCGILVAPGNEADLSAAMGALARDSLLRTELGRTGRQVALRFSWDDTARRLDELYRDGLTQKVS
jgi:glycosyltransferase involved in cell wall biosynthesis